MTDHNSLPEELQPGDFDDSTETGGFSARRPLAHAITVALAASLVIGLVIGLSFSLILLSAGGVELTDPLSAVETSPSLLGPLAGFIGAVVVGVLLFGSLNMVTKKWRIIPLVFAIVTIVVGVNIGMQMLGA